MKSVYMPCPALPSGQGRAKNKFLGRAKGRAGQH